MKAIIIENEYTVDESILAFLKDNPNLFESVQEELYCLYRDTKSLVPEILKNDSIIAASTWMYKDQLEEFLDGFLSKGFPTMNIFAHRICNTLNEWNKEGYLGEKELVSKVVKLLDEGFIIYDFYEDMYSDKSITDSLNIFHKEYIRVPYIYKKIFYNKELKEFKYE